MQAPRRRQAESERAYAVLRRAGTKLKMSGRLEEGLARYEAAVAACGGYAPAHYNIGVIHSERRDFGAARAFYERAIEAHPGCLIWPPSLSSPTHPPSLFRHPSLSVHQTSFSGDETSLRSNTCPPDLCVTESCMGASLRRQAMEHLCQSPTSV
jgi:tetratricopeptide (TPR) repeat protein